MERKWLEIGEPYSAAQNRHRVEKAIAALRWHSPEEPGPLSPMATLQAVVAELRLPKVSALAYGGGDDNVLDYPDGPETAAYTVVGVEANFTNGRARLYLLDIGTGAVPLAVDHPIDTETERPDTSELFPLGRIVATPGALERMEHYGINAAELLRRHHCGDWGDIQDEDRGLNEEAIAHGDRILSVYGTEEDGEDRRIWIITEAESDAGREATTLLLPDEY